MLDVITYTLYTIYKVRDRISREKGDKIMSYEVGDIVTIRDDLRRNTKYYMDDAVTWNEIVDDMEIYKGKEVTIVEINEDGQYKISSGKTRCTYLWVDEMIKGVEE